MDPLCPPTPHRRLPWFGQLRFLAISTLAVAIPASSFRATAAPPNELPALRELLSRQVQGYGNMETLRATYSEPKRLSDRREFHEFVVRLEGGIQVVSEEHEDDDVVLGKYYFLRDSEVYALRVWHRVLAPDKTSARIAQT